MTNDSSNNQVNEAMTNEAQSDSDKYCKSNNGSAKMIPTDVKEDIARNLHSMFGSKWTEMKFAVRSSCVGNNGTDWLDDDFDDDEYNDDDKSDDD